MVKTFTAVDIANLKREAARRKKASTKTHAQALDEVAREQGFSNWSLLSKASASAADAKTPAKTYPLYLVLGDGAVSAYGNAEFDDLAKEDIQSLLFSQESYRSAFLTGLDAMCGWGSYMPVNDIEDALKETLYKKVQAAAKKSGTPVEPALPFSMDIIFGDAAGDGLEKGRITQEVLAGYQRFNFASAKDLEAFELGVEFGDGWNSYADVDADRDADEFAELQERDLLEAPTKLEI